jgi:hypothetical protein
MSRNFLAISKHKLLLSITQGPAIRKSRRLDVSDFQVAASFSTTLFYQSRAEK